MPIASSAIEGGALHQNRLDMSTSSGFCSSPIAAVRGSSAIPQIGHELGEELTISGCIGHTNSEPGGAALGGGRAPATGERNASGSAAKRPRQRSPQKK